MWRAGTGHPGRRWGRGWRARRSRSRWSTGNSWRGTGGCTGGNGRGCGRAGGAWGGGGGGNQSWTAAVYQGQLYVGGTTNNFAGSPAALLMRWNGSGWGALGTGMNAAALAFAEFQGDLYAAGLFTEV